MQQGEVRSADGTLIRFGVAGNGRPALVFVHGWAGNREFWREQVAAFAGRHQVVTIDLAGHGESAGTRSNWTTEHFAEDVLAVAQALQLDDLILLGHSAGGPVCLVAGPMLGERLRAIIGVDTFRGILQRPPSERFIERMLAPFAANYEDACLNVARGFFPPGEFSVLREWVAEQMLAVSPRVGLASMRTTLVATRSIDPERITVPIHTINSAENPTPRPDARAGGLGFELHVVSGVGHFLMLENPALFNAKLQAVLDEIVAGRSLD